MDYKKLIQDGLDAGFSDIEIYIRSVVATNISIFNGEIDKNQYNDSRSFSVRAIYNDKMAYLTYENEFEDIDYIIETLKNNAKTLTTLEEFEIFGGSKKYPSFSKKESGFNKISIADKAKLLLDLENEVKSADSRIVFVPICRYSETNETIKIMNSKGLDVKKSNEYCLLVVQAVAKELDQTQSSFEVEVALTYDELDTKVIGKKVAEKAIKKLNAKPVPSKTYPIVFDREAMADLFQVFSSMFSGEAAIKKLTPLLGKEGQKIFSDKLTVIDDPLYEWAVSKEPFDDEGVACYRKEVVKDGVVETLLHNLKTARYFKTTSTGNGFKSGSSIGVSGTNLYILGGSKTQEQLIENINEGILITDLAGLHAGANPVTGDFSAQSSGFLIKDGKIDRPVNLIVVSGNFIKLMNQIDQIGNDMKVFYTGIGTPSMKFTGLLVSGK